MNSSETVWTIGPQGFGAYEVRWPLDAREFVPSNTTPTRCLAPGFVDIHVHGAFGVDFMSASSEQIQAWCERLRASGYEAFLPTTITAKPEKIRAVLSNLPAHPMILGFHLEGPFISPKYPGAQPQSAIVEPPSGASEWDGILGDTRLRVVTMAPEVPNGLEMVRRLSQRGVVVSMGHTNATFDEARRGFEAGATNATHTYNAMRPLHHRETGILGFALLEDRLNTELIYDHIHVNREAAALLLKCKPLERIIAISDGTMASGMPPGAELSMWGLDAVTGDKEVHLKESGALAGSAITLLDAFQNLHADFGPEVAMRTTSVNPRRILELQDPPKVWSLFDKSMEILEVFADASKPADLVSESGS